MKSKHIIGCNFLYLKIHEKKKKKINSFQPDQFNKMNSKLFLDDLNHFCSRKIVKAQ